jgi:hypothetical protein
MKLLGRLMASASRSADQVERMIPRAVARLHDGPGIEPVERHQTCGLGMHLAVLDRGPHVDQLDLLAPSP